MDEGWDEERWMSESHWPPAPIALTGTANKEPSRGLYFQKDIQINSLGPQEASPPSPTPKTFLGPLLLPDSLPFPTAPSQRAKGSTAKESYLLSAPFIPVLFTLGLQLTESLSQIN